MSQYPLIGTITLDPKSPCLGDNVKHYNSKMIETEQVPNTKKYVSGGKCKLNSLTYFS
jgi:hypothetical protein